MYSNQHGKFTYQSKLDAKLLFRSYPLNKIENTTPITMRNSQYYSSFQIVVYTVTPDIDFDAVELASHGNSEPCAVCDALKYKVTRDPPLAEETIITDT